MTLEPLLLTLLLAGAHGQVSFDGRSASHRPHGREPLHGDNPAGRFFRALATARTT